MRPSRPAFTLALLLLLPGCASNNVAYNYASNAKYAGTPDDHPPLLIHSENPIFPPGPRTSGKKDWSLEIRVGFIVDSTGAVRDPVVLSSTDSFYDSLALESIRKWRFAPAMQDGKPVATRMTVPFQFKLDGS